MLTLVAKMCSEMFKQSLTLVALAVALACTTGVAESADNAPVAKQSVKNPRRTSVALPTRNVRDRNGNVIFKAPVPLKVREVPVSKRSVAQKPDHKASAVNSTLQRAREARERKKIHLKEVAEARRQHEFKEPTREFVAAFQEARIHALGSIYLMSGTVKKLFDQYPKSCRFLDDPLKNTTDLGSVVCENTPILSPKNSPQKKTTYPLGEGPQRVFFAYLRSNDVLVGADFEYSTERQSKDKFLQLAGSPVIKADHFVEEKGSAVDSPYWRVSRGESFGRYFARITTNFNEGQFIEDEKEKKKAENVRLGELELNRTTKAQMPETTAECRLLGVDREENMYEYYGECFGFGDLAHYQLNFNDEDKLETFVLRPESIGALADMSAYLAERFGVGKTCRISQNDSIPVLVKEDITSLDFKFNYVAPTISRAVVYAGSCERPFIYESPRRLYFTNRKIQATKLSDDYRKRKLRNQARIDRQEARALRQSDIREYFSEEKQP